MPTSTVSQSASIPTNRETIRIAIAGAVLPRETKPVAPTNEREATTSRLIDAIFAATFPNRH
jgi:hypothetical protein